MFDDFRYTLTYNCSNFLHDLEYKGYLKREELQSLLKPIHWLIPERKPDEQELVNIKNLHPVQSKKLIARLQEDIKSFEEAEAEILVIIDEVNKLLDLNTYTSVYYASNKWKTFWRVRTKTHPMLFIIQRAAIVKIARRLCDTKLEMFR